MKYLITFFSMIVLSIATIAQTKKPQKKPQPRWRFVETGKEERKSYWDRDTTYGIVTCELGHNGSMQGDGYVVRSQYWNCGNGIYSTGYWTNGKDTIKGSMGGMCSSSGSDIQYYAFINKNGKYVLVETKYTITPKK